MVVKVQRPGVAAVVARDLDLLHMMAAALERTVPETKIYSPVGLVDQFDRSSPASSTSSWKPTTASASPGTSRATTEVRFPKSTGRLPRSHVLVQELFDGQKITETRRGRQEAREGRRSASSSR